MLRPTFWLPIYDQKEGIGESIAVHASLLFVHDGPI